MFLPYRRLLSVRQSLWEQSIRCLFGFGKKKPPEGPANVEVYKENKTPIDPKDDLPIKVIPPNIERRMEWLPKKAIIFYVPRRRSGYAPEYEMEWSWRALVQGYKYFCTELALFYKELTDLEVIKELPTIPGITDKVFDFKELDTIDDWVTTADSDHSEGYSTVEFIRNKDGNAVFKGNLSTQLPKDGRIKFTGYVNVRGPAKFLSFRRRDYYNWVVYNTLEIRIRGDGRTYMINLHAPGDFDTLWDDMFNYPVYTRGGPYWQTVRIPFSKFLFSNKGKVQDTQYELPKSVIQYLSITLADNADGPFTLEIAYIGVLRDDSHTEKTAYEEYKVPNYMIQN